VVTRAALAALLVAASAIAVGVLALSAAGDPNQSGERVVSVHWNRDPNFKSGGRKLHLLYRYRGYSCQYRFHRARAKETDDAVTVKVQVHWRPMKPDEVCTAELGGGAATVQLDEKLGGRKLRHAKVTDPG
jgi:hypothetical protein